jgi:DNA repair protein RecN (Recombination protein N)
MLSSLSIRDVVIIDRLDLELPRGLCALTGETGAGKSILLDALGLGLGARGDVRLLRHGAEQASVVAGFELAADHPAHAILTEQGLADGGGPLLLRRLLGADGRSRAFVNDQPVGIGVLRRLGETLVEIHGQYDNQRLLDPVAHRDLLDAFGGLTADAGATAAAWRAWQAARAERRAAEEALIEARRDEAFLRHAIDEIAQLAPQPGEEAELAGRRAMLMNTEKLLQAMQDALAEVEPTGGRGVADHLRQALRSLERIAGKAEGRLDPVIGHLERALAEVADAADRLARVMGDADLDPHHLEAVEERLFALRALSRKHGVPADDLARLGETLVERVTAINLADSRISVLGQAEAAAERAYLAAAGRLGRARQAAAGRLDTEVAGELQPLRLGKARFATRIEPLAAGDWGAAGQERVYFEVATNPGTPPGPLARIASGGELARFMLALKVVLARADPVPTLVFDEVDAGVGGAVADAVGERLARLAADVQVLVVTHSPQVAARGHHQWQISKRLEDGTTRIAVEPLDAAGRREEIARMLAGAAITDEARAAADSLLQPARPSSRDRASAPSETTAAKGTAA